MGCDIHLYVEKKVNGRWKHISQITEEDDYMNVPYDLRFYTGRNYKLFSILANVRNGYGFAGCDTGDALNYIDMPRGIPNDASDDIKKMSDYWEGDGHSHSWFTLSELCVFDWTQKATLRGIVNAENYYLVSNLGRSGLKNWCGMISGPDISIVDNETMQKSTIDPIVRENENAHVYKVANIIRESDQAKNVYTKIEWHEPYNGLCEEFWHHTMPKLMALTGGLDQADDIRIIFWFDN